MEFQSGVVSPVESIKEGWRIIKDDYWTFFLMILVAGVIVIVAALILGAINNGIVFGISTALGMATVNAGDAGKVSAMIIPQLIALFISIFTNIIVITLSGALMCGIYSALVRKTNSGVVDFGDLFSGFQKLQPCFIIAVIMSLIQFVIGIVTVVVGAALGVSAVGLSAMARTGKIDPAIFGGLFLGIFVILIISILINLIISVLTYFVYPLIAVRNLTGIEALMTSVRAGLSNIGGLILLIILTGLMTFGGVLVCFVGVLFVFPVVIASVFAAFQSVFGRTVGDMGFQTPPPPPNFG